MCSRFTVDDELYDEIRGIAEPWDEVPKNEADLVRISTGGKSERGVGAGEGERGGDAGDDGPRERGGSGRVEVGPADAPIVVFGAGGGLRWKNMKWGFSYDGGAGGRSGLVINARSETLFQRKMFRDSAAKRRCVIPARSFFEWDKDRKKVEFFNNDGSVIYLAGIYRDIENGGDFVVITRDADSSVGPVHDRMPLVMTQSMIDEWVNDEESAERCIASGVGGFSVSGDESDEAGQIDMFSEILQQGEK